MSKENTEPAARVEQPTPHEYSYNEAQLNANCSCGWRWQDCSNEFGRVQWSAHLTEYLPVPTANIAGISAGEIAAREIWEKTGLALNDAQVKILQSNVDWWIAHETMKSAPAAPVVAQRENLCTRCYSGIDNNRDGNCAVCFKLKDYQLINLLQERLAEFRQTNKTNTEAI